MQAPIGVGAAAARIQLTAGKPGIYRDIGAALLVIIICLEDRQPAGWPNHRSAAGRNTTSKRGIGGGLPRNNCPAGNIDWPPITRPIVFIHSRRFIFFSCKTSLLSRNARRRLIEYIISGADIQQQCSTLAASPPAQVPAWSRGLSVRCTGPKIKRHWPNCGEGGFLDRCLRTICLELDRRCPSRSLFFAISKFAFRHLTGGWHHAVFNHRITIRRSGARTAAGPCGSANSALGPALRIVLSS